MSSEFYDDEESEKPTPPPRRKSGAADESEKRPARPARDAVDYGKVKKNYILKPAQAILGISTALHLSTMRYMCANPEKFEPVVEYKGQFWIERSQRQWAEWEVVSEGTLFSPNGPDDRLRELRLAHHERFPGPHQKILRRINDDRVAYFLLAALMLHTFKNSEDWRNWAEGAGVDAGFQIDNKPVFPGLEGSRTTFRNKTPFAMSKHDVIERNVLHRTFSRWNRDRLAVMCVGKEQVVGFRPLRLGRIPTTPR